MARFSPLILPPQITALPQNYGQILPLFDGTTKVTTQQHIVKVIDFIDLEETDNDDAKMCIIEFFFFGEVKKWFHSLTTASVANPK